MEPTKTELSAFIKTVDDFLAMRERVLSKQAQVYATNDPALIGDYESFLGKANALKSTIEATTGAWNVAKREYQQLTGTTSMVIGDAIDEIRSWFGYKPAGDLGALGLIQLPAAAWVAGIIAAATLLWRAGSALLKRIDAVSIAMKENIPYDQALVKADKIAKWDFLGTSTIPLVAAAALAGWYFLRRK